MPKVAAKSPAIHVAHDVILANHHTADIILSRVYHPNSTGNPVLKKVRADAVVIPRKGTILVKAEEFELRRNSRALKFYIENGMLSVSERQGVAETSSEFTRNLEVPEHLQLAQNDGEISRDSSGHPEGRVVATIKSKHVGTIQAPEGMGGSL